MRGRLALAPGLAVVLAAAVARAQPPPDEPDAAYRAGRERVEAGDRLYDAGEYRAAAAEYRAAYALLPLPDLLFNIAQSFRLAGDTSAAVDYYRRYLAIVSTGPAAAKAREHLAALEEQAPRPPEPEPPPPERPSPPEQPAPRWRWVAPVVAGAGVAIAATGVALHLSAGRSFDQLDRSCAPACDPDQWSAARRRERLGVGLAAAGGAVAVTGVVLWVLAPDRRDRDPAASAWLAPGTAGGMVTLRF